MRAIARRLRRLERLTAQSTAAQRFRIQYGYLKTLPDDRRDRGSSSTVKQLPLVERGEDWFEWEERPGPEPLSTASPNDDIRVRVCYVERTPA